MRIVLLTPRRRFIANRFGLGYQLPLGLVCIGGPLSDAGHRVNGVERGAASNCLRLHADACDAKVASIPDFRSARNAVKATMVLS